MFMVIFPVLKPFLMAAEEEMAQQLTDCSSIGPMFNSQQPHGGPKLSVIPVPRDLKLSSGTCGHAHCTQACM